MFIFGEHGLFEYRLMNSHIEHLKRRVNVLSFQVAESRRFLKKLETLDMEAISNILGDIPLKKAGQKFLLFKNRDLLHEEKNGWCIQSDVTFLNVENNWLVSIIWFLIPCAWFFAWIVCRRFYSSSS